MALQQHNKVMRLVGTVISLFICFWLIWTAGQAGFSRLLSTYAAYASAANVIDAADRAVRLTPSDPEAHYTRATVLSDSGDVTEGIKEFEQAIALQPRRYVLWLELGNSRDSAGDMNGALAALKEAVRLAPYYAQPRWRLGNLLLRTGRLDEGFEEIHRATASDPSLFPAAIDLAWGAYNADARKVEQVLQPQTSTDRLVMARYFAKRGKTIEAIKLFRDAGGASEQDRLSLLAELLAAKKFKEAYEVWASASNVSGGKSGGAIINNGGFENRLVDNDTGFGWQFARDPQTINISLDTNERRSGAHSLRVNFNGASAPSARVLSRLVLVEPNTPYQLSFAVRTQDIVTGGLPMVTVRDAGNDDRVLAQSKLLPQGTSAWQNYEANFTTPSSTEAVVIALQRQNCSDTPCPIFGQIWFDDFTLKNF